MTCGDDFAMPHSSWRICRIRISRPLPKPRLIELVGKRATGYVNWRRKRERIHRPEVLAKIVADIKRQGADHIAVTGDLVNLALPDEYAPARAWLDALGGPADVTLVPGNHDAYVHRGIADARTHWGDFMCGDATVVEREFPFVRRRGPVALIGVSTSVPSLPLMATGRVGTEQLQRLGPVLDETRKDGRFRVVLIHHPPVSKRSHYLKRLTDASQFRDVVARHGAELVIHGHNHRRQTVFIDGPQRTRAGGRRAVGIGSAARRARSRRLQSLSDRRIARRMALRSGRARLCRRRHYRDSTGRF